MTEGGPDGPCGENARHLRQSAQGFVQHRGAARRRRRTDGISLEIAEIGDIPLYNDDVRQAGFPPAVQRLRDQIAAADALLFATPEYNYSISGVLKNV